MEVIKIKGWRRNACTENKLEKATKYSLIIYTCDLYMRSQINYFFAAHKYVETIWKRKRGKPSIENWDNLLQGEQLGGRQSFIIMNDCFVLLRCPKSHLCWFEALSWKMMFRWEWKWKYYQMKRWHEIIP